MAHAEHPQTPKAPKRTEHIWHGVFEVGPICLTCGGEPQPLPRNKNKDV